MSRFSRKELLGQLVQSLKRRGDAANPQSDTDKADLVASSRMPWQKRVAADLSKLVSVLAARRVGKSWYALSKALEMCLRFKGSEWVIIGLTRPSVKSIYWTLLKNLNQDMELGLKFHGTELTARFRNGSVIRFTGAENRGEIEKLRGGQYNGVVIDECKSFSPVVFSELIKEVILPALLDRNGQLTLIGTPGDVLAGPFYEATCTPPVLRVAEDGSGKRLSNWQYADGAVPVCDCAIRCKSPHIAIWSKHTTTLRDNTEARSPQADGTKISLWEEALNWKHLEGIGDENPVWRREYLGEWVASDNRLVYRYQPHKHVYDGVLPDGHEWLTVMGFDMGYRDADAIVVWAYSPTHPGLYEMYSDKRPKLNIGAMCAWIRDIRDLYSPMAIAADFGGLATKVMESIADDYGIIAEPAEKKEKYDFVEIFNNDFDAVPTRIFLLPESELGKEMLVNRWLESSLGTAKRKEDDATPNDLCDAALYAFRWALHRKYRTPERRPTHNSPEYWAEYRRQEMALAIKQANRHRLDDYSELDPDI